MSVIFKCVVCDTAKQGWCCGEASWQPPNEMVSLRYIGKDNQRVYVIACSDGCQKEFTKNHKGTVEVKKQPYADWKVTGMPEGRS